MIELTDTARERFDSYLMRLRSALRGARSVEPDDVEQSVREHIEFALAGTPAPVGAEHLGVVLDRLGPPERWIPEEERPIWKQMFDRLRSGPEDWRLAYLAFGMFALTFLLMPMGGILLLIPAFLMSRAYIAFVTEKGEPIGARRWLVYPAIVLLMLFVVGTIVIAPGAGITAFLIEEQHLYRNDVRMQVGAGLASIGGWLIVAAGLLALMLRPLQAFFRPVLDTVRRKHFILIAGIGVIAAVAGAAILIAYTT
ncbi:MAG TPA: hypothetical protein VFM36_15100 [Thermoanaerobaculia bacterium]|nr:hypothetical protein [Thermoanaerobaculia bacterium]